MLKRISVPNTKTQIVVWHLPRGELRTQIWRTEICSFTTAIDECVLVNDDIFS